MKAVFGVLIGVIVVLGFYAISFGITALIFKGICWAFSLTFSWKVAFGIWLIMMLVKGLFDGSKNNKGDN
jgi:hypothetical protein